MAKQTIHTLAYNILMDTTKFSEGVVMSRSETSKLNRTMSELKTPLEKVEDKLEALAKGLRSGALTADEYNEAVRKLGQQTPEFQGKLEKLRSFLEKRFVVTLSDVVGGFRAVGRGLMSLGRGALNRVNELDTLAKAVKRVNINSAEFQKLAFGAETIAGASSETLLMALQRMVRRISEAQQGKGEAIGAINELNLDPFGNMLGRMSPSDQFKIIADAIAKQPEEERIRLMKSFFDSEGVALEELISAGSEGIEAAGKRLEELGGVKSEEQLRQAELAADAMTEIGVLVQSMTDVVVGGLSPLIPWFQRGMEALIRMVGPLAEDQGLSENPGTIALWWRRQIDSRTGGGGQVFNALRPEDVALQRKAWESNIKTADLVRESVERARQAEERARANGIKIDAAFN